MEELIKIIKSAKFAEIKITIVDGKIKFIEKTEKIKLF